MQITSLISIGVNQLLHNGRIRQCRNITQFINIHFFALFGNLSQNSSHDLARAGFWQPSSEMNHVGCSNRSDFFSNQGDEFFAKLLRRTLTHIQSHIGIDTLAFDVVTHTDHGGFRHMLVKHQGGFNFGGTDSVARNVEHIINTTREPIVSIRVPAAAVTRQIISIKSAKVGIFHAVVITKNRSQRRWPRFLDDQKAFAWTLDFVSLLIQDRRMDS
mmetsp:Transcript_14968/g.26000  ORF Transcript_14968/g.26000 Transcript_14968/m.26000 type:complete len:216 (+) Transcript_14968:1073-1720(+)